MKINTAGTIIDMRDDDDDRLGFEVLFELPVEAEKEDRELCTLIITSDGSIFCRTGPDEAKDIKTEEFHIDREYRIVKNKRGQFRIKKCGKKYV